MKTASRFLLRALAPASVALFLASCSYDPYAYGSGYYGGGYSGTSSFYGSVFVSTSDPYWGYDPYRYCYYNYRRRCYYDPWLNWYYPSGYLPRPIAGCPHPYGWRPGHGVCPAPRNPSHRFHDGRTDRLVALRSSNHSWARNVRFNEQSLQSHMRQNPQVWRNRIQNGPPPGSNNALPAGRAGRVQDIQHKPRAGAVPPTFNSGRPGQTIRSGPPPQQQMKSRGNAPSGNAFKPNLTAMQSAPSTARNPAIALRNQPQVMRQAPPQMRQAPPQMRQAPQQIRSAPPQVRSSPPQMRSAPPPQVRSAPPPQPSNDNGRGSHSGPSSRGGGPRGR